MNSSPLQLRHYFFVESVCKAKSDYPFEAIEPTHSLPADAVLTSVDLLQNNDDQSMFQVNLDIESIHEEAPSLPYEFKLLIIGFFQVAKDFEPSNIEHLVRVNGASVLYSAAREYLMMVTSRGPFGPVMLPTINFRLLRESDSDEHSDTGESTD